MVFHEQERCPLCYDMRLVQTVQAAIGGNYDAFTTTLLYSKYQQHQLLIDRCNQLAEEHGTGFYYEDFRSGWQQAIDAPIRMGL